MFSVAKMRIHLKPVIEHVLVGAVPCGKPHVSRFSSAQAIVDVSAFKVVGMLSIQVQVVTDFNAVAAFTRLFDALVNCFAAISRDKVTLFDVFEQEDRGPCRRLVSWTR